jgi:hypothetical protein
MHTTGRAATNRLNLAEMEDFARLAHTALRRNFRIHYRQPLSRTAPRLTPV